MLLGAPGIDVNRADMDGETPLTLASTWRYRQVVTLLLGAPGIHVLRTNKDGKSALDLATKRNRVDIISLLEELVDAKHSFVVLLRALTQIGLPCEHASDLAMRHLPSERTKALATRARDT